MELDHPHEAAPRYHQQRQRVSFEKYFEGYNRLIKNDFIVFKRAMQFLGVAENWNFRHTVVSGKFKFL